MTQMQMQSRRRSARLLVAAAVLEATAGVLGLVGLGCCTIAVTVLARNHLAGMEVSPGELARRNLAKARAATAAGLGAWRGLDAPGGERTDSMRRGRDTSRV